MYLTASLLPPHAITRDVHDFATINSAAALADPERPTREPGGAQVLSLSSRNPYEVLPTERMAAELARFGYVTTGEVDTVRSLVADLIAPHDTFTVSLGGSVHVDHVRQLILVGLQGETDRLEEVFDALHASVHRAGFARDRRRFRPMLPVLSFRPSLKLGALVRTVEALEGYASDPWTVTSIGLVHRQLSGRDSVPIELDHLPFSA